MTTSRINGIVQRTLLLTFCLTGLSLFAASQGEWTQFRGPNGTAISPAKGIPTTWTASDYKWQITLPGSGYSSPVIWQDKLFLTCTDKKSAKMMFLCLDTKNGKTIWQREYATKHHRQHRDNSFATSTPVVDRDRVYFYWAYPEKVNVIAMNHAGKELWRRDLGGFKSQHGPGPSTFRCGDLLIVPSDHLGASSLMALDLKTGKTRWTLKRESGRAAYSTPCLYTPKGGKPELILTSTAGGIAGVNPEKGTLNWAYQDAFPQRVVSSPVIAGDVIIGSCGQGGRGVMLTAVKPGAPGKPAKLAYQIRRNIPYVPTPIYKNGLVFSLADSGYIKCFKPDTGDVVWEARLGEWFYSSFVCAGDRLYVPSKTGTMFVIAAADQYKLISKIPLGEGAFATPAIADNVMYIRTFTKLMALEGKK